MTQLTSAPPQAIELLNSPRGESIRSEAITAALTAIVPGMLVQLNAAGEMIPHATAAGTASALFALNNMPVGGTIDDAYAPGTRGLMGAFQPGQEVYAWLADGSSVNPSTPLESAGDGSLRLQAVAAATAQSSRHSVIAYPLETINNTSGGLVRIKIRVA